MARESKFVTDRRKKKDDEAPPRGAVLKAGAPPPTRSVLGPGERLNPVMGSTGRDRNQAVMEPAQPPGFDWMNPIPEQTAQEIVGSLPGPLGVAATAIGSGIGRLTNAVANLGVAPQHPGMSPRQMAPPGPIPPTPKEIEAADIASRATAAAIAANAGEVSGQGANQKPPAPSSDMGPAPKVGTGPGAVAERPGPVQAGLEAGIPGLNRALVTDPNGRRTWQGVPYRLDAPGPDVKRDHAFVSGGMKPPAYSERVRGLIGTMPKLDVEAPGTNWTFTGGLGSKEGGPREGTRELSGLEQSLSRTDWLTRRADEEKAMELARREADVRTAELDRREALAQMDPLEIERIRAEGRMGGDVAQVERDVASRREAMRVYTEVQARIEMAYAELSKVPPDSPEASRLQNYISYLERLARERSSIALGVRPADPRTTEFASFFGANLPTGSTSGGSAPSSGDR